MDQLGPHGPMSLSSPIDPLSQIGLMGVTSSLCPMGTLGLKGALSHDTDVSFVLIYLLGPMNP